MKFIDLWNGFKNKFTYGIDYIDEDAGNYIAVCVATYDVMHQLMESGIYMHHCTVQCRQYLIEQFENHALSDEHGIKVFYFLKNADVREFDSSPAKLNEIEFCGWIKPKTNVKVLYHFCDVNNIHKKTSDEIVEVLLERKYGKNFSIEETYGYANMIPVWEAIDLSYDNIINSVSKYDTEFYHSIMKETKKK
jgi:hypothetical protein